jgi:hypothetical protein
MNRHFEDTAYYLKRAGETATAGVRETIAPVERRVRALTGREREPEPTTVETIKARVAGVREAVGEYRPGA